MNDKFLLGSIQFNLSIFLWFALFCLLSVISRKESRGTLTIKNIGVDKIVSDLCIKKLPTPQAESTRCTMKGYKMLQIFFFFSFFEIKSLNRNENVRIKFIFALVRWNETCNNKKEIIMRRKIQWIRDIGQPPFLLVKKYLYERYPHNVT